MKKKTYLIILSVVCGLAIIGCLAMVACFVFGGKDKPNDVFLVDKEITVYVGESYEFKPTGAESFTYTSSDEKIAKVTESGLLTGVSDGSAFIDVSAGEKSVTCKVNVIKAENYIRLNSSGVTVAAGSDLTLNAEVISGGKLSSDKVVFGTNSPENITITQNGDNSVIVSVTKTGNYVVTVTCGSMKAECVIKAVNLTAETLAKPVVSVENCVTVKWNAVENASAYMYSVNEGEWVKTTQTSFDAKDITDGLKYGEEVVFAVKAMADESDFDHIDGLPASVAFSHEYEETADSEEYTCAKAGKVKFVCSVCNKEYTDENHLADHNMVDGACTVCGLQQTKKVIYRYDESNDCYFVVGADAGYNSEDLYILAKYNDGEHGEKPVKYIGYGAFAANKTIKRVYLPESMTEFVDADEKYNKTEKNGVKVTSPFRGKAFDNCTNLEFVSMKGVTMLCAVAEDSYSHWNFRDCYNLKQVIVGNGFDNFGASFMRWGNTPDNAENQTDIYVFGDHVTKLEAPNYLIGYDSKFGNNMLLTGEVFCYDENSTDCYKWHYAEDGKTIVTRGKHEYNNKNRCKKCGKINSFGVEYKYNEAKDVYYVAGYNGKNPIVTIPETWNDGEHEEKPVKYVEFEAFRNNTTITKVILPKSVDSLEGSAFFGCKNLEYVSMTGVKIMKWASIYNGRDGDNNFRNCNKLKYVIIGTELTTDCGQFNTEELPAALTLDLYVDGADGTVNLVGNNALWTGNIYYKGVSDQCFKWDEEDGIIEHGPSKHNYVNGVCTVCGEKDAMGVIYKYNADKDVYYVSGYNGTSAAVNVFATWNDNEHDEKPVKYVGFQAFMDNTTITKVVLPESVDSVESMAFWGCSNLEYVSMIGVTDLKYHTSPYSDGRNNSFRNCFKLKVVVVSNALSSDVGQFGCGAADANNKKILDFYVYGESGAPDLDYVTSDANNLCSGKVYYYSETRKADCWHYDENGDAVLWD